LLHLLTAAYRARPLFFSSCLLSGDKRKSYALIEDFWFWTHSGNAARLSKKSGFIGQLKHGAKSFLLWMRQWRLWIGAVTLTAGLVLPILITFAAPAGWAVSFDPRKRVLRNFLPVVGNVAAAVYLRQGFACHGAPALAGRARQCAAHVRFAANEIGADVERRSAAVRTAAISVLKACSIAATRSAGTFCGCPCARLDNRCLPRTKAAARGRTAKRKSCAGIGQRIDRFGAGADLYRHIHDQEPA
jgi:hypothetical protein